MRFLKRLLAGLVISFGLAGVVGAAMGQDAAIATGIFCAAFSFVLASKIIGDGDDGGGWDGDSSDSTSDGAGGGPGSGEAGTGDSGGGGGGDGGD